MTKTSATRMGLQHWLDVEEALPADDPKRQSPLSKEFMPVPIELVKALIEELS